MVTVDVTVSQILIYGPTVIHKVFVYLIMSMEVQLIKIIKVLEVAMEIMMHQFYTDVTLAMMPSIVVIVEDICMNIKHFKEILFKHVSKIVKNKVMHLQFRIYMNQMKFVMGLIVYHFQENVICHLVMDAILKLMYKLL